MKLAVTWALVGVLALGLTGCQPSDDAAEKDQPAPAASSPDKPSASVDLALIAGTVPPCPELTSAARLDYRQAAFRACEQAVTADQRMKNTGCYARQRISQCVQSEESRNYTLEQYNSEKKAALQ